MSEILHPFGATIYYGKATEEELKFLKKSAELSRTKGKSMGSRLAGNIDGQIEGSFNVNKFKRMIRPYLIEYTQDCYHRLNHYSIEDDSVFAHMDFDQIDFSFGDSKPWFNFMKANEFNPLHNHSGFISAVIMIDVPEVIEEENKNDRTNMPCRGQLEWVYENNGGISWCGSYKIIPKTGDIFLFPADLKHQVYPFTSDVERVSMSFNIYELKNGNETVGQWN